MVFGGRFRGIPGSIAAFLGLVGPPVVIVTILRGHLRAIRANPSFATDVDWSVMRSHWAVPGRDRPDDGAAPEKAGACHADDVWPSVFVAIGILRLPLVPVLLTAIPISIFVTFLMRRRMMS